MGGYDELFFGPATSRDEEIAYVRDLGAKLAEAIADAEFWEVAMTDSRGCADRLRVELAEAKRVAVWMVRQEANFFMTGNFSVGFGSKRTFYEHDGTDADIYRALVQAMKGGG
jgi:hypothetical protein